VAALSASCSAEGDSATSTETVAGTVTNPQGNAVSILLPGNNGASGESFSTTLDSSGNFSLTVRQQAASVGLCGGRGNVSVTAGGAKTAITAPGWGQTTT
jgi:hypothetical protein